MMYRTIEEEYFGIKIEFKNPPVSGYPNKVFYFSCHDLLVLLLQSSPLLYEMIARPSDLDIGLSFPVQLNNWQEWIDYARTLKQASGNTSTNPMLVADVGGRKIIARVPSDKYLYDWGKLPDYKIYVESRKHLTESSSVQTHHVLTKNETDLQVITQENQLGENPVRTAAGKERMSYMDFYHSMAKFYGGEANINSSLIVQECRRILQGSLLDKNHAPVIPLMLATIFGAEVSRNRACLVTGLMLLDLIQAKAIAPNYTGKDFYNFKNSLWHPALYALSPQDRKSPENEELSKLGGFHPMAHLGSWSEEFKEDGPYQRNATLTMSHIKSINILIDWLTNYPLKTNTHIKKITRIKKQEYKDFTNEMEPKVLNHSRSTGKGNFQLWQLNHLIIVNYMHPLISTRLNRFDFMLKISPGEIQSDNDYMNTLIYGQTTGLNDEQKAIIAFAVEEMDLLALPLDVPLPPPYTLNSFTP